VAVWVDACGSSIAEGSVQPVIVAGHHLVVARCEGAIRVVEDRCTHDDGPLGEGRVVACEIVCPRHGARFDLKSGAATRMPAISPIRCFPVKEEAGRVLVDVEGA
jgi:3-phenylpropionate/trans-cinnamate dioxygenase ferredoxin subunit